MSGFSPEWLALREPADLAARAPSVLACLEEVFSSRDLCRVWDLGAGTGASLRALAECLPDEQHWTLLDHDPVNLAAAGAALAAWADESESSHGELRLRRGRQSLLVRSQTADLSVLAPGLGLWPEAAVDLVTASALLDLTSADWIAAFADAAAECGAAVLATLNFDGVLQFAPSHNDDAAVREAFCAHQRRDKGFGPAAGPDATRLLASALEARDYRVQTAASPWRLGPADAALLRPLITGIADAVAETGALPTARLSAWRESRLAGLEALVVGHQDLIASPH